MKILNILGSPRKSGTSTRIARAFTDTAAHFDAQVVEYPLNTMPYRGCQGCEGCHTRADSCVLRDDLTPLLDDLYEAEFVVLSSPIYFGDTCGQFKCFYDRMWSLVDTKGEEGIRTRLPAGKTALLVLTQVDAAGAHRDVVERYTMYLELYGFEVHIITAPGLRLEPNGEIDRYAEQATELARTLMRQE